MKFSNRQERRAAAAMARTAKPGDWGDWERRTFAPDQVRNTVMARMLCAYVNRVYSVQVYECEVEELGIVTHLALRRHDTLMPRAWSDLQRIKDELVGPERVAVEVFPKRTQLVDVANMAHLWVFPEGYELPFGLHINAWGVQGGDLRTGLPR